MIQTKRIKKIINKFSEKDINGFKKILYAMIEQKNKIKFDEINNK